jgi:hypothetical protein
MKTGGQGRNQTTDMLIFRTSVKTLLPQPGFCKWSSTSGHTAEFDDLLSLEAKPL